VKALKNSFVGYAAFSGAVHLLVKIGWVLGMEPAVQRTLGNAEWGRYFSAYSLAGMLLVVLDAGLSTHQTRVLSTRPESMPAVFRHQLGLKLLLFFLYLICLLAAHTLLGWPKEQFQLLMVLGLFQGFLSWNAFLRAFMAAQGKFRGEALLANLDKFLLMLMLGMAFALGHSKWLSGGTPYAWLLASVALFSWLVTLVIMLRQVGMSGPWFPFNEWKQALRQGMPYAVLTLIMGVYLRLELVWMRTFLPAGPETDQMLGVYAAAWRPLEAFFQFSALFSVIVLPMAARWIGSGKNLNTLWWTVISSMGLLAWVLSGLLFAFPMPMTKGLYLQDLEATAALMSSLAPGLLGLSISLIAGVFLTAAGKIRSLIAVAGISAGFQVLADALFISWAGSTGAAWAFNLGQGISAVLLLFLSYRNGYWKLRHRIAFRSLTVLFLGFFFPVLLSFLGMSGTLAWVLVPGIMAMLAPFFMWQIWKQATDEQGM